MKNEYKYLWGNKLNAYWNFSGLDETLSLLIIYCIGKTGLDTDRGFCDTPASFPGILFKRSEPCSEQFVTLAASAGLPVLAY